MQLVYCHVCFLFTLKYHRIMMIMLCNPVKFSQRFGGTHFHLRGERMSQAELCMLTLSFDPENGGDMLPWNFGWISADCTELYPRRQNSDHCCENLFVPSLLRGTNWFMLHAPFLMPLCTQHYLMYMGKTVVTAQLPNQMNELVLPSHPTVH